MRIFPLFLFVFLTLVGSQLSAQTIFDEQFNTEAHCAKTGADDSGNSHSWFSTCDFIACQDFGTFCGVDTQYTNFEFRDLDGQSAPDSALWYTDTILISDQDWQEFDIEVHVQEFTNPGSGDCFYVRRSLDGGTTFVDMGSACGNFTDETFTEVGIPVTSSTAVIIEVLCRNLSNLILVLNRVRIFNAILPVSLQCFTAEEKADHALLSWKSSSESNFSSYVVQHSRTGRNFRDIGVVEAAGSIDGLKSYSFKDYGMYQGANFYRLKQLDIGGSYSLSDVARVQSESGRESLIMKQMGSQLFLENPLDSEQSYKIYSFLVSF